MFKFVLDTDDMLYVGRDFRYHKEICGGLPARKIAAAGQLIHRSGKWILFGESFGYNLAFNGEQADRIYSEISKFGPTELLLNCPIQIQPKKV